MTVLVSPPIDANHRFDFTMAATESRRIDGITVKRDRAVNGGIDQAAFQIAFDHAQKNSTLHAPFASAPAPWREPA
jgi:hypothetical protein